MKRSIDRILTTHVGSIVRPEALVDLSAADREKALPAYVNEVVKQQAAAGLDVVNDGEYGKSSWSNYVLARLTGFEPRPGVFAPAIWLGRDRVRFADFMAKEFPRGVQGSPADACIGPISYKDHAAIHRDTDNLKAAIAHADVQEGFLTTVAPASVGYDALQEHYTSEREYIFAIADALREEYRAVYESGLILQVDDAVMANMYDHFVQQGPAEYRKWAELRVEALNHALEGIPADRVRYHVCFGSWHVPHVADAPLEDIVDLILQVNAGAYLIEAANVRHEHEWRVWEKTKLPAGKILMPGVVTHHTKSVEHPRLVADRIVTFAKLLGRENIIASTDCGFAQWETIARVHPQVMWAKFESLAEGARLASQELWGRSS